MINRSQIVSSTAKRMTTEFKQIEPSSVISDILSGAFSSSSSTSITEAASSETDAVWHRRYYAPPIIYNGFYFIWTIYILNIGSMSFTLIKYDTHNEKFKEFIINSSNIDVHDLVKLCTHFIYQYKDLNFNMYILNSTNHDKSLQLKINSSKHIFTYCKNVIIIKSFALFLSKSMIINNYKQIIVWRLEFENEILTKHKKNDLLYDIIIRLHQKKRCMIISDVVNDEKYIIYLQDPSDWGAQSKYLYIVKLIMTDDVIPVITRYNIYKRANLDIIIYNGLLFFLSHECSHINIFSLKSLNRLGKIRTFIQGSRFKTHLVLNKRLYGLRYILVFAEINQLISDDVLMLIEEYSKNWHHFKFEIVLSNRMINWHEVAGEDNIIKSTINMHEIISHLDFLCLLQ